MKRSIILVILGLFAVFFSVFLYEEKITPDLAVGNQDIASGSAVVVGGKTFIPYIGNSALPHGETPNGTPDTTKKPENRRYKKIKSNAPVKDYGNGVVSVGDTAYEQYSYIEVMAEKYAGLINNSKKKFGNKVKVYNMIVPTSIGIILPDNKKNKVNSSDQKQALDKMHGMLSKNVMAVPVYDSLMEHRTEYVYFRTDHHWTQLGAYYAYKEFCNVKGIEPNLLSKYKKDSFGKYLGSFYKDSNKNPELRIDSMKVYYPLSDNKLSVKYTDQSGNTYSGRVIENGKSYGINLKYVALIDGDNPFTVITNKSIKDKSSIIVVKESFGNAFVPYLADHYNKIYVIDYRYWEKNLNKLVKEKGVSEVLFLNNISMTRNSYLLGRLAAITGE